MPLIRAEILVAKDISKSLASKKDMVFSIWKDRDPGFKESQLGCYFHSSSLF